MTLFPYTTLFRSSQATDLDPQARPMRLVGAAGAERARDQGFPVDIPGPCLSKRERQREQHRPACKRPPRGAETESATAGIDYQRVRGEKDCDLVEAQRLLGSGEESPRGRTMP